MLSKRQAGVTMIELMVVVLIAAILAAMAVPSFSSFIQNTRLTSTMTQLTSELNRARSEAIKRNTRVLVCVRGSDTDCGAITSWQNGWLVCYDGNTNGQCDIAPTDGSNPNPIVVHQAINSKLTLSSPAAVIWFNPNGTANAASTLVMCCKSGYTPNASSAVIAATGFISRR